MPERIVEPYSWVEHIPFVFYLVGLIHPARIVELGVHTGNSFCAFCQAIEMSGVEGTCYGIDTWAGDEHSGRYGDTAYDDLQSYVRRRYGTFANLIKADFNDSTRLFDNGTIDILHIDGYHTYDAVKNDYENWRAKMAKGGIILFHDTEVKDRDFGVWRFWAEISTKYPSFNFTHGYGLGLLAIEAEKASRVIQFVDWANSSGFVTDLFARLGAAVQAMALKKVLDERDRRIALLNDEVRQLSAKLQEIYGSQRWRLTRSISGAINRLLPQRTRRRSILTSLIEAVLSRGANDNRQ